MLSTKDIFGGADEFLVSETILAVGSHGNGSYTNAAGTNWTEYEYIEIYGVYSSTYGETVIISKEQIAASPTSFEAIINSTINVEDRYIVFTATGANTYNLSSATVNYYVNQIKGYKKKYGTRNTSKTVMVNGGADIAVNSRYEIDIATELGTDYLNRDLVVVAEIYNDGVTDGGVAGWGETGWYGEAGTRYGVKASVLGNKIVVQTAQDGICGVPYATGNPFNNTTVITDTPCQVKVWKVDEYLPATKSSGDITTIWTGSAGNAVTIDWSGTGYVLSQFDTILLTGTSHTSEVSAVITPSFLLASATTYVIGSITIGTSYSICRVTDATETSIVAGSGSSGFNAATVTGIYGINYN